MLASESPPLNLARTEGDERVAIVALYRALGGGWQLEKETS
jgi:outer membrane protein TolC